MQEFYADFEAATVEDWIANAQVELKGEDLNQILQKNNLIEELTYPAVSFHLANKTAAVSQRNLFLQTQQSTNNWINGVQLPRGTKTELLEFAQDQLTRDARHFQIDLKQIDFDVWEDIWQVLKGEDLSVTLIYHTNVQFEKLKNWLPKHPDFKGTIAGIGAEFDRLQGVRNYLIRSFEVQYVGGNITQELAYALHQGHARLYNLLQAGLSVREANQQIHFQLGVGTQFLPETVKFEVFKYLWQTIIAQYDREVSSDKPYLEVVTGFLNKSLKDPYTNLLRQTTEAMSAILGGVDILTILPYNAWSSKNKLEDIAEAQRLALNIALLLKEESYLDKVIDPLGGSYSFETLFELIAEKSWRLFQEAEEQGLEGLKHEIKRVAQKRVQLYQEKKQILIGVNQYANPITTETEWGDTRQTSLGEALVIEKLLKNKE